MANNADNKIKAGKGPGAYTPEMSWESWSERFEFFIKLKGVTDPEIKKLLLFSELGPVYDELRRMAQLDDVRDMEFNAITKLMDERFGEVKSIAAKRHELFNAKQGGQIFRDYSIQLRSLISKADWGKDSIDMCLTALFINGIKNDTIRAELIKKGDKDLKFKDAVELACILEQSNVDAQAIGSNSSVQKGKLPKFQQPQSKRMPRKLRMEIAIVVEMLNIGQTIARTKMTSVISAKRLVIGLKCAKPKVMEIRNGPKAQIMAGIDKEIEQIRKECTICQSNSSEERQVPLHPGKNRTKCGSDYMWISLDHFWDQCG
jgi:hypothetical protein